MDYGGRVWYFGEIGKIRLPYEWNAEYEYHALVNN
jgi:hypothetical protein